MKRSRRVVLTLMGSAAVGAVSMGFVRQPYCGPGLTQVPGANVFLQAFPIRPESSRFKSIVDLTIVEAFASGEWDRLYDKYFGPQGVAPFEKTAALSALALMNAWPAE